ncbi:MAG: Fe-S cluster assembly scaffold protein NifU [Bacillota bacterium]|nr:Fe-S cluster assembly scaffold protein NifU [Bacillota bacterium]
MSKELYTDKVMDHFMNPRNVGEIPDADGVGQVGNPVCGDVMRIYLKIDGGRIQDVKFKTFGCGAAIATSSIITEMVKGMTVGDALEVSNRHVADALGGLPPRKMHCSNLAADALLAAVNDYRVKHGLSQIGEPAGHGAHQHEHDAADADDAEAGRPPCTLRVDGKCVDPQAGGVPARKARIAGGG